MAETRKPATDTDLAAYLDRKNLRNAPPWMPEPGTTVRGKVIGLTVAESDYGPYPRVIYRNTVTGEVFAVHAFHSVLRDRLVELKTEVGIEQYLSYDGKRKHNKNVDPKTGEPLEYHMYDVENVGQEETSKSDSFSWALPGDRD